MQTAAAAAISTGPDPSTTTPDSILAAFRRDLKPATETEDCILRGAAQAQYRLERVSAALLAELDARGFTDLYFKLQRSEAKDRASLHAHLNQYRQLESRRIRHIERLKKKLDAALDRAVTPRSAPAEPSSEPPSPPHRAPSAAESSTAQPGEPCDAPHPRAAAPPPPAAEATAPRAPARA